MQLRTEKLNFTYNKGSNIQSYAVKDVTLTIPEGSFFGIIGHTGSGKSTFVAHLNGLKDVQSGIVTIGDVTLYSLKERKAERKAVKKRTKSDPQKREELLKLLPLDKKQLKKDRIWVREKVGMVFQYPEYQLFAETVEEDVAFAVKNFAQKHKKEDANFSMPTEEEIASDVRSAMEYVGLNYEEYRKKSPFDLSGGQKRRVAIAGVLVQKPEILVLDEPVAGLDPEGKAQLFELLHLLHRTVCKTIVIVSHDMDDISENCTDVAVFNEGRLALTEKTETLFRRAEFLKSVGLDLPLSAYLAEGLKKKGVRVCTDFTEEDFIERLSALFDAKSRAFLSSDAGKGQEEEGDFYA